MAKYYTQKGLYVEPSDGAVFAFDGHGQSPQLSGDDLGSACNYAVCEKALQKYQDASIGISEHENTTFCVLTSKTQIAVVEFRAADNSGYKITDYKFRLALFPLQLPPWQRMRK